MLSLGKQQGPVQQDFMFPVPPTLGLRMVDGKGLTWQLACESPVCGQYCCYCGH